MTIRYRIVIFWFLALCVALSAFAEESATPNLTIDAIERQLETYRHENLLLRIVENDAFLNDFTTDGCSGGLSAGWEQFSEEYPQFVVRHGKQAPWRECCVSHDRQYHSGGLDAISASESFEQRKSADLDLKDCVVGTGLQRSAVLQDFYGLTEADISVIYEATSELMYRAVRIGGIPCTNQTWRWGYGWQQCR
jgi:hypothetical protein